jgi:DnaJ-class molecular chaperone
MMNNPYHVLGVSPNASPEQIKKAFKQLAMKHHPDRGGDEAEFKKINEAYAILSDPERKQQHDNPGFHYRSNPGGNFHDVFDEFFRHQRQQRTANVRLTLHIDLKTAAVGGEKLVSLQTGNGIQAVEIEIPEGINDGDTVRYPQLLGNSDLQVTFRIHPDKTWARQGNNLTREVEVDFWDFIIGTKVEVETLYGDRIVLTVPPQTQPGTLMRVKGKGMRGKYAGQQGDMFVKLSAKLPKDLPDDLIDAIKRLRN